MALIRILLAASLLLILVGCTTPKPQPDAFAAAEQAIEAAIRAGAEQHSPVELRFAREKLDEARRGMEVKQYDKSFFLIDQSQINSELAIEKSRAAIVRNELTEQMRLNQVLQEDFERTYGGDQ